MVRFRGISPLVDRDSESQVVDLAEESHVVLREAVPRPFSPTSLRTVGSCWCTPASDQGSDGCS